jgi:hypothetical protein
LQGTGTKQQACREKEQNYKHFGNRNKHTGLSEIANATVDFLGTRTKEELADNVHYIHLPYQRTVKLEHALWTCTEDSGQQRSEIRLHSISIVDFGNLAQWQHVP